MFVLLLGVLLLAYSTVPPGDQLERIRAFTRQIEFDYVTWTLNALGGKIRDGALGAQSYLAGEEVDRGQEGCDHHPPACLQSLLEPHAEPSRSQATEHGQRH